jgi:hypothetical protein
MALGPNPAAIQNNSGGEFWVSETTSTGSTTGTWQEMPLIEGVSFTDETSVDVVNNDAGNSYPVNSTREAIFEATTMQKDADTLKWATETARGKYYHVLYKLNSEAIDGNNVWHFIPIAKVDPVSGYSTPGTTGPVYRFRAIANASAISGIDASTVDADLSSISCAAGLIHTYLSIAT